MKPVRKTIVNCGVSHVSASVFSSAGDGGMTLESAAVEVLQYDYSDENQWLAALGEGLQGLCGRIKGLKGEAYFILPGNLLLTKTIRAPHVEPEKRRQIVKHELQNKMPYLLSELIWDYQVVEDDGVEQEVLAIAVKPAVAESFCEMVDGAGLNPVELSAASILDFNALRHSHIGMEGEETLVINVGAKSTNLLFINPEGFLIRNIALGGNSLSQHVSDSLGVPFSKAEELKKTYFTGEVAYSADDPAVQVLEKNAEQFKARLSQEVTRSVVTYKRLKKGKSPTRIFLCGQGALLPGLPEYLSEKQVLAVDYFDPMRSVQIGSGVDPAILPQLPFILSEVVGEACRLFADDATAATYRGINLLPKSKLAQMAFCKKRWWIAAAAGLAALTPLPGMLGTLSSIEEASGKLEELRGEASARLNEVSEQEKNLSDYLSLDRFARSVQEDLKPLREAREKLGDWRRILPDLQRQIFSDKLGEVWLDELYVERPKPGGAAGSGRPPRRGEQAVPTSVRRVLVFNGRFLVRETDSEGGGGKPERARLRDLSIDRQKTLTENLNRCTFVDRILTNDFAMEKKGDLYNRFYTHFHYEILLKEEGSWGENEAEDADE